ncbi:MAG: hypothetical protein ACOZNI_19890 [Myxococcota bacterium]
MDCNAEHRDPLDLGRAYVEWVYEVGAPVARINLRAGDRADVVYWIEGRVRFAGNDVTWIQGPYEIDPLAEQEVDIAIPTAAQFSADQVDYTSDLVVRVVAADAVSDENVDRVSPGRLKAAWPAGEGLLLMDDAMVESLAPNGILDAAASEAEAGVIIEYGPPR